MNRLFLPFLLCAAAFVSAQDIQWEHSYGGRHAEYLFDAEPTADYGFILAGSSLSKKTGNKTAPASGDLDYWIWKMDGNGDEDWQKSFGGTGQDLLVSLKNTADGGFILGGTSDSPKGYDKTEDTRGGNDYWIVKLDARGRQQWQKTFGGSGQDDLSGISPTRDGGYIVGGNSASERSGDKAENSRGNMDYWIIKLDGEGNEQWQKTFGGQYADMLKTIEPTADGGYIVGGYSNSPESKDKAAGNYGDGSDFWILKLSQKGDIEWQQSLGGDKDDALSVLHQTYDGGFILGGSSNSGASGSKSRSNGSGTDFWVVKLDEKGTPDWQQTYDFGQVDMLTSLVENEDHSFLIGGTSISEGNVKKAAEGTNDYIALKISENGERLWEKTVGSDGQDILKKAIETRDGGYLLAGTSDPEDKTANRKGKGKKALSGISGGEELAGAKKAQDMADNAVNDATGKANDYYKEQTQSVTEGIKDATGLDKDSPVKLGGDLGNALGSGKSAGNPNTGAGTMAQAGPKPGSAASRDKKTNFGGKDFWVVKLKDKDKIVKDPKTIEAFPNPTRQFTNVIVGFDYDKGTAMVFDLLGRQLQSFAVTGRTIPVDLGPYPEGIYIVKVVTDKGEGSMKIIKGIGKN